MADGAKYTEDEAGRRVCELGLAPLVERWLGDGGPTLCWASFGTSRFAEAKLLLEMGGLDYVALHLSSLPLVHVIADRRFPADILRFTPSSCTGVYTTREAATRVMATAKYDGVDRAELSEGWAPSVQAGGIGGRFLL